MSGFVVGFGLTAALAFEGIATVFARETLLPRRVHRPCVVAQAYDALRDGVAPYAPQGDLRAAEGAPEPKIMR